MQRGLVTAPGPGCSLAHTPVPPQPRSAAAGRELRAVGEQPADLGLATASLAARRRPAQGLLRPLRNVSQQHKGHF